MVILALSGREWRGSKKSCRMLSTGTTIEPVEHDPPKAGQEWVNVCGRKNITISEQCRPRPTRRSNLNLLRVQSAAPARQGAHELGPEIVPVDGWLHNACSFQFKGSRAVRFPGHPDSCSNVRQCCCPATSSGFSERRHQPVCFFPHGIAFGCVCRD